MSIEDARRQLEENRRRVAEARIQTEKQRQKIPETSQKQLRQQGGLAGRQFQRGLKSARERISQQLKAITGYEEQLSEAEQQISEAEQIQAENARRQEIVSRLLKNKPQNPNDNQLAQQLLAESPELRKAVERVSTGEILRGYTEEQLQSIPQKGLPQLEAMGLIKLKPVEIPQELQESVTRMDMSEKQEYQSLLSPSSVVVTQTTPQNQTFVEQGKDVGFITASLRRVGEKVSEFKPLREAVQTTILTTESLFNPKVLSDKNQTKEFYNVTDAPTKQVVATAGEIAPYFIPVAGNVLLIGSGVESYATAGGRREMGGMSQTLQSYGLNKNVSNIVSFGLPALAIAGGSYGISKDIRGAIQSVKAKNLQIVDVKTTSASPNVRNVVTKKVYENLDDGTLATLNRNKFSSARVYKTEVRLSDGSTKNLAFVEFSNQAQRGNQLFAGTRKIYGVELDSAGKVKRFIGGSSLDVTSGDVSRSISNILVSDTKTTIFGNQKITNNQLLQFSDDTISKSRQFGDFTLTGTKTDTRLLSSKGLPKNYNKIDDVVFNFDKSKQGTKIFEGSGLSITQDVKGSLSYQPYNRGNVQGFSFIKDTRSVEGGVIVSDRAIGGDTKTILDWILKPSRKMKGFSKTPKVVKKGGTAQILEQTTGTTSSFGGLSAVGSVLAKTTTKIKSSPLFSGLLGTAQVLEPTSKTKVSSAQVDLVKNKQLIDTKQEEEVIQANILKQPSAIKTDVTTEQEEEVIQANILKQPTATILRPEEKTTQRTSTKTIPRTIPPTIIPTLFPTPSSAKVNSQRDIKETAGYYAEIKERGKWKRIVDEALRKKDAEKLGRYVADNTLGASYRVKPANKEPALNFLRSMMNHYKFRDYRKSKGKKIPLNDMWIEKVRYRLDKPLEKLTLQQFRNRKEFKESFEILEKPKPKGITPISPLTFLKSTQSKFYANPKKKKKVNWFD